MKSYVPQIVSNSAAILMSSGVDIEASLFAIIMRYADLSALSMSSVLSLLLLHPETWYSRSSSCTKISAQVGVPLLLQLGIVIAIRPIVPGAQRPQHTHKQLLLHAPLDRALLRPKLPAVLSAPSHRVAKYSASSVLLCQLYPTFSALLLHSSSSIQPSMLFVGLPPRCRLQNTSSAANRYCTGGIAA